ncbi:MAG: RNA 2',3'-cyclic phosphodiesterase [Bacillota bacterium]
MILIRAFIGIDFDSDCKKNIYELQQRFRKYAVKGRWKYIDNFHLTLKFLDEISVMQEKQIDEAMRSICTEQKPFTLEITEPGIFEGKDAVRVLWLGLAGNLEILRHLAERIDKSFHKIGFPLEKRRYTPHVTIGQDIVFECPFSQIRDSIGSIKSSPVLVNKLILFKSEQLQNKRVYTPISEYSLKP